MILDERTEFADAVSVAAAAGTALIGDQIDSGPIVRDLGQGQPIWLVITVDTEIITAGSAGTLQFKLVSDAAAAIATDGSATEHLVSPVFVTDDAAANSAALNAGAVAFAAPLPVEGNAYERYLGILAITGTTTTTAGKINAFLTLDPPRTARIYAEGAN